MASQQAEERLEHARRDRNVSKQEIAGWTEQVRRGPPLPTSIYKKLQTEAKSEEAKHLLNKLCDDAYATSTMGPHSMRQIDNPQLNVPGSSSRQSNHHLQPSMAAGLRVPETQKRTMAGQQGEEFGLGHDPGEQKGGTATPGTATKALAGSSRNVQATQASMRLNHAIPPSSTPGGTARGTV